MTINSKKRNDLSMNKNYRIFPLVPPMCGPIVHSQQPYVDKARTQCGSYHEEVLSRCFMSIRRLRIITMVTTMARPRKVTR
jgi:hypothetical protein